MPTTKQLQEINDDIKDIINTKFEFTVTNTGKVPNFDDPSLTFETNQTKKGKTIETCVLYIDIRSSTDLSNQHQKETMGKLYTAFVKGMIYAAELHEGRVRNIIGDRVMVVFQPNNCFTNAVNCAITMNTIASQVINKHFKFNEFKCGIGIDYGRMLVLKIGIKKLGKERAPYKNLVWIGNPANIASKLTDLANKTITNTRFKIKYKQFIFNLLSLSGLFPGFKNIPSNQNSYSEELTDGEFDSESFISNFDWNSTTNNFTYSGGKIEQFTKIKLQSIMSPILMTEKVYTEFKRLNPSRNDVINQYWKEQQNNIKQYNGKIFGGNLIWPSIENVKL